MSRPLDTNLNDITTVAEAVQFLQAVKAQHIAPRPLLPNGALAINLPEGSSPPDIGAPDAPYGTIFANVLQIGGAPLDTTISAELERLSDFAGWIDVAVQCIQLCALDSPYIPCRTIL